MYEFRYLECFIFVFTYANTEDVDIYIENVNTIHKWIKEISASECNLENEKAIHERNNFRFTSKFQAVGNIYVHGGSVVVVIVW
jgi:hypothetical protein